MNTPREKHASVVLNGKIYAIGGYGGTGNYLNTIEMYDPSINTWTPKASMEVTRISPEAEVVDGEIYVIGGYTTGGQRIGLIEVYDPVIDSWTSHSEINIARPDFTSAVVDGIIYVIGGSDGDSTINNVEAFQHLSLFRKL